ncbi:MAG: hypothetical protein HXX08_13770 [Chloroflexi bacterium]|uniref:6-bladed beta-propeller n=1 Tax=Candidatus Chlorohelix allophototropha TaxID=3003348 RepID=A0A8T7M4C8_9CHLR|nr:hypothetical protein [Chloroflexota bacterium]WJW70084.1 6-bladed beta-propeller [Chloroflexota bacterium L227-S17]
MKFDSNGRYLKTFDGASQGLWLPVLIVIDKTNSIYVGDEINNLFTFNQNGEITGKIGSKGSNPGQFNLLTDMAIDNTGNRFILDSSYSCGRGGCLSTNNGRIQRFDSNDKFQSQWGTTGLEPDRFQNLQNVFIDNKDNIYVYDTNAGCSTNEFYRLKKFANNGQFLSQRTTFIESCYLTNFIVDNEENLFIPDGKKVKVFDSNGNLIRSWDITGTTYFAGYIATDRSGILYFSPERKKIVKYSRDGQYLGELVGNFNEPEVLTGSDGNLYVINTGSNPRLIQVIDTNGSIIRQFTADHLFNYATDKKGNFYVYTSKGSEQTISKYTQDGNYTILFNIPHTDGDGQIGYPKFAVDTNLNVIVLDSRIQKFRQR